MSAAVNLAVNVLLGASVTAGAFLLARGAWRWLRTRLRTRRAPSCAHPARTARDIDQQLWDLIDESVEAHGEDCGGER